MVVILMVCCAATRPQRVCDINEDEEGGISRNLRRLTEGWNEVVPKRDQMGLSLLSPWLAGSRDQSLIR